MFSQAELYNKKQMYNLFTYIEQEPEAYECIVAKIFSIKVEKVVLGSDKICIRSGKLYLSPILNEGYIEIEYDDLLKSSKGVIILYYMAGVLVNILDNDAYNLYKTLSIKRMEKKTHENKI